MDECIFSRNRIFVVYRRILFLPLRENGKISNASFRDMYENAEQFDAVQSYNLLLCVLYVSYRDSFRNEEHRSYLFGYYRYFTLAN